ncbi:hypothetical protein SAMD00019534_102420 [Acytostelium subglobosum LB1]|uniref:hypothetical protein n=1 Tax=Acytostelium subglobosum LB1 TaxID=1410327 RepID=UPI000645215F|nr:hypothetical protein SAMD00019534_102420 [Acytostelium subglobosum LB1]GAM27067.1 hypothetical protein SAMD00019534_102420 [Acytostelium subglobosum LB1]|eukprot:XP_012749947.1 hypothetical protein SAMD00019534_102420 [Acytostelium subglobosum LB1]
MLWHAACFVEWAGGSQAQRAQKHAMRDAIRVFYESLPAGPIKDIAFRHLQRAEQVMTTNYKNEGQHRDRMSDVYCAMVGDIANLGGVAVPPLRRDCTDNPSYGKIEGGWFREGKVTELVGKIVPIVIKIYTGGQYSNDTLYKQILFFFFFVFFFFFFFLF